MGNRQIETFEDLRVWQLGMKLVKQVYLVTQEGAISQDFGFRDQFRSAAVAIPSSIAEGFERYSRQEYADFISQAKGAAGQVRSLLRVGLEVGYLDKSTYFRLYDLTTGLSTMLTTQIRAINRSLN